MVAALLAPRTSYNGQLRKTPSMVHVSCVCVTNSGLRFVSARKTDLKAVSQAEVPVRGSDCLNQLRSGQEIAEWITETDLLKQPAVPLFGIALYVSLCHKCCVQSHASHRYTSVHKFLHTGH